MALPYSTTVIGGINVVEMLDGYSRGIHDRGGVITKRYWCDWADAFQLANKLMGISTAVAINGTITRTPPHVAPEAPNLYCQDVQIEGSGAPVLNAGRPTWTDAILTATYMPANWGPAENDPYNLMTPDGQTYPFCTFSIDYAMETTTIPGGVYKFAPSGTLTSQHIVLKTGSAAIGVTVHRVPFLPLPQITLLVGSINNATFLNTAAGYILFEGAKTKLDIDSMGTETMDIEYSFKYRSQHWNHVYNQATNAWGLVTIDGTTGGAKLYPSADLRPLLFGVTIN